jgi:hypothetical protein
MTNPRLTTIRYISTELQNYSAPTASKNECYNPISRRVQEVETIPTLEQKTQCYILCCRFTKLYLPINIVRMDERTGNIFFLAGEENILEIYPNGKWRYIG